MRIEQWERPIDQILKPMLDFGMLPNFLLRFHLFRKKHPWNAMEKTEENSGIKISSKASKSEHEQIIFVAEEKMNNFKTWLQIRSIPRENIEQYSFWLWFLVMVGRFFVFTDHLAFPSTDTFFCNDSLTRSKWIFNLNEKEGVLTTRSSLSFTHFEYFW